MKKLLVTGASGFLGWHCSQYQQAGWKMVGVYNQHKKGVHPSADACQLDLTDKNAVWRVLKMVQPDAVFHLAAHSGTGYCEKNPKETRRLNVDSTSWLAEMCADLKSRFLFTSSEQVFDGGNGNYVEGDLPNPKNEYGKQKQEAENRIQEIYPEAMIVRIAVLYGKVAPEAKSFLNQWLDAWSNLTAVTAFYDEFRQFLSAGSCTTALFHLLKQGAEGVFHLGGREAMSRYEFGKLTREVLELNNAKLESKSQMDIKMPAFRPPDLSLNCTKIIGTGITLSHPLDELKRLKPNLNTTSSISLN